VNATRVRVPVPAETGGEDRLVGTLTFRHAAYLAAAAAGAAVMLLGDRSAPRIVMGAAVTVVALAGAWWRPFGEPVDLLAPAVVAFFRRRRPRFKDHADATRPEPAPAADLSRAAVEESAQPEPRRLVSAPRRHLAIPFALLLIALVAAIRWPSPRETPTPQVVVVPVPPAPANPWGEVDDAFDTWLDAQLGL
jgi:hypothetical protein